MTNQGWKAPKDFDNETRVGILITPSHISNNLNSRTLIMTANDVKEQLTKYNLAPSLIQKHIHTYTEVGLLPLYSDNQKLPILARMCGYILTDGSLNIYDKLHGGNTPQLQACFGTYKDALLFEKDIKHLGMKSVNPREGIRTHPSGVIHHTFDVCHNGAIASLFIALGVSFGKKTETERKEVPSWIMEGCKLIQREFCAGIQGGDGCMIRFNKRKSGYNYICAQTSQQIHPEHVSSMVLFMTQIVTLMRNLGVEVNNVVTKQVKENRIEVSYKIRDTQENLIKYNEVVGYRYAYHKTKSSAIVTEYLKWKSEIVKEHMNKMNRIRRMFDEKETKSDIITRENVTEKNLYDIYRAYKKGRSIGTPCTKDMNIHTWLKLIEVKGDTIFMPVTVKPMSNCMIADITVESDYHCFFGGDCFAVHNSAMGKQAVGIYMSNFNQRIDTLGHILNYPQKPLARTKLSKYTNSDAMPSGVNAVIAIMTKTGFNQEDSVMVNRSALDRGLFTSTYYKAYRDQCSKNHSTGEEEQFTKPAPTTSHIKPYNYDKLDSSGFVPPNTYIDDTDVLVGKIMPHKVQGQIFPRDMSMVMKANDHGYVDMNYQGVNGEGYKFCKIRIRKYRKPTIGDKVSSRHGQKGTIGMIYAQEDMPFSKDGITPDVIVNPHAIPSRMTVGQLIECIMGKSASFVGAQGDATPFNDCGVEDIANILESYGMERYGNEILYNGRTGEMIHTEIFMGPTFYQRLKHMVSDKMHSRGSNGPVVMLTRQPAEGRARNGGLRFGEMERDAIVAHGAGCFLKERMLDVSDNYRVFVCKKCGLFCVVNPERNIWKCNNCRNQTDIVQARIPYSMKLLIQELMTMGIAPRMNF
jgi:DNA-directed RNA polymerase beta subunit